MYGGGESVECVGSMVRIWWECVSVCGVSVCGVSIRGGACGGVEHSTRSTRSGAERIREREEVAAVEE